VSTAREATPAGDGAGTLAPPDAVFAPVRSQTAFEETVDRLGTAIKLGLLPPGSQLPAERELCARLGIARSTLRQALTALTQSGHVFATRGRGGGTFVSDPQPPADPPSKRMLAEWRDICDQRLAIELGVAVLAAQRAAEPALAALDEVCDQLDDALEDFAAYRQADIRLHVGLAEAARSEQLVREMTDVQGAMTDLISYIAHPPEVLSSSNAQHRRLLAAVGERDAMRAAREMTEHLKGTEHVLAGLLPQG
jgi:GntR family transcriptional regulator, transcriptional repressor for pyruvate dehydrogenase complex